MVVPQETGHFLHNFVVSIVFFSLPDSKCNRNLSREQEASSEILVDSTRDGPLVETNPTVTDSKR